MLVLAPEQAQACSETLWAGGEQVYTIGVIASRAQAQAQVVMVA